MKKYENNPFTLSFGNLPSEYIPRANEKHSLIQKIISNPPLSHFFVITGIRGSGKTVLLTGLSSYFDAQGDYIVIELNPEDDLRESLAAKLYSKCLLKRFFTEKSFSFSFSGVTFSISGKNPVFNIDDLLDKMFAALTKQGKKVIVLIDEVTNNSYLKQFALSAQILIRNDHELYVVMTSLYENISAIENENNLTFLIRAPRIYLSSLNVSSIANSYQEIMNLSREKAVEYAKITKGYAFAFQLLGYLLFQSEDREITAALLNEFDQYLEEYVYRKVWSGLSPMEQSILQLFDTNEAISVSDILEKSGLKKEYFSKYRDRLMKKGVLISPSRGQLMFALPRFKEYIESRF